MKVITCFVKTADKKDTNLLSEKEKNELAKALRQKAMDALLANEQAKKEIQAYKTSSEDEVLEEMAEESQEESTEELKEKAEEN